MRFEYLVDNKELIPIVANWLYTEFVENIRHGISLHDVIQKLESGKKDVLPITIIATEGTNCIGTVSLFENDLKSLSLKPWLAALVVDKQYRGAGIGKRLITEISNISRTIGFETLYLRTEHASDYYKKLGWALIDKRTDEFGIETEVFSKELNSININTPDFP
ncbi:GNAT family N-acetyltransferase [Sporomusa aerivorans]|uniref:GNAT family N-acetyltransferase n=1 Tax=Sporomusa aerivorans TaxID=204936 RepID=UPI00352B86B7